MWPAHMKHLCSSLNARNSMSSDLGLSPKFMTTVALQSLFGNFTFKPPKPWGFEPDLFGMGFSRTPHVDQTGDGNECPELKLYWLNRSNLKCRTETDP